MNNVILINLIHFKKSKQNFYSSNINLIIIYNKIILRKLFNNKYIRLIHKTK